MAGDASEALRSLNWLLPVNFGEGAVSSRSLLEDVGDRALLLKELAASRVSLEAHPRSESPEPPRPP